MTDIVERLRKLGGDTVGNYGMPIAHEAADEIESLRQQLATTERLLAESQAREFSLREAMGYVLQAWEYDGVSVEHSSISLEAQSRHDMPFDSTALDEALAKAKRAVLLEAAKKLSGYENRMFYQADKQLIRMADELKGGEQ